MIRQKKKQKQNWQRLCNISGILLIVAFIFSSTARVSETFANWYSKHIYRIWVGLLGRVMGTMPFSVVEILLYIVIIMVIGSGIYTYATRKKKEYAFLNWLAEILLVASVLIILYVMNCGINYHRTSFADETGIVVEEYSAEELQQVCRWLTDMVNDLAGQVTRDADGHMQVQEVSDKAAAAMTKLGMHYETLEGHFPRPKPLLISGILSVQQLTGIYAPFTIEANYNRDMTDYNQPFTACHELSHLRGFMQEQEANFIGFLACTESDDAEFRYSGAVMGWIYCMNVLYKVDYDAWQELHAQLATDALGDLQENNEFWARYDGKVAEVSNQVNDSYLKANGQNDGVKSYDRMVDLIVEYWKSRKDARINDLEG